MRDFNTSPRYLATVLTAYYYYRKANGLPDAEDDLDLKIDRRRHLPTLPPETTLQASIATARRPWWQAYFRLLYEAGPRPTEPLLLQKQDVNFDRQLIRLGTEKGSGETLQRELPISQLLTGQLRVLTASKTATDPIFTKPYVKPLKAIEYEDARTVMVAIRKQLQATGYNVNGLVLYAFRHAFATRLFYATGQKLELVSRAMGHRDPETTRLYLHLQPDQPQRFDVVRLELTNKEAIGKHLGEGWELAVQTPMELWFKRPKWVP
jgi:integrase